MFVERHLCGRPTQRGAACRAACRQRRYEWAAACNRHLEDHERAQHEQIAAQYDLRPCYEFDDSMKPACWSWPAPTAAERAITMGRWHPECCAICGHPDSDLVCDHDHDTGWIRGYLCRGCNIAEGSSQAALFRRYRRWHPARMHGSWVRYDNPYDYFNQSVVRVASDGVIDLDRAVLRGYWGRPEDLWRNTAMSELLAARLAAHQPDSSR